MEVGKSANRQAIQTSSLESGGEFIIWQRLIKQAYYKLLGST